GRALARPGASPRARAGIADDPSQGGRGDHPARGAKRADGPGRLRSGARARQGRGGLRGPHRRVPPPRSRAQGPLPLGVVAERVLALLPHYLPAGGRHRENYSRQPRVDSMHKCAYSRLETRHWICRCGVLHDDYAITIPEEGPDEGRFVTTGMDALGRVLVVVYTWRENRVRIISARAATSRERRQHERTR